VHQPKVKDGPPIWGPDFSEVEERRKQIADGIERADTDAAAAIFGALEQLSKPCNSEKEYHLALALARVATLLPHRRRPELVQHLLALTVSWASKQGYLVALVLSGETPSANMLLDGIKEFFEEAKTKQWLLDQEAPTLRIWLELLPFSDRPSAVLEALELVPSHLKAPWMMRQIMNNLSLADDPEAEQVLFALAERDPRLYGEHDWVSAVVRRETETAYTKLFELAEGNPKIMGQFGGFHFEAPLRAFIEKKPGFRSELLLRYKAGDFMRPNGPVEMVLMKTADAETVIALFDRHAAQGHKQVGELRTAIESAVLEHREVPGWNNSYEIHGKPAPELRKELFGLTQGPNAELAASCLTLIDRLRDEHGRVKFEPRHSDIDSKLPWPTEARPLVE
jgi:hypothetical protein